MQIGVIGGYRLLDARSQPIVIVLGIVAAEVGWKLPGLSLAYSALMIINAIFFHMVPFVAKIPRGVEQSADSSEKTPILQACDAESDARSQIAVPDERLRRVIEAWDRIPEAVRAAIAELAQLQSKMI